MIRKHQPDAMIINNAGLSEYGKVGHFEIDRVTFERGRPALVDNSDRKRAEEISIRLDIQIFPRTVQISL